jgi:hypothetical protein
MRRSDTRHSLLLAAAAGALALTVPSSGQGAPQSLLPPGFGEEPPAAAPTPAPATPQANPPGVPVGDYVPGQGNVAPATAAAPPPPTSQATTQAENDELPPAARRSPDIVGPLGPENTGLGANAFGDADGRFLTTLMRRMEAPVASRWVSILLRRALLSRVPAPAAVRPVDWVADRALLLLKMGEADGARMLVQAVDVDRYTPKMYAVAAQTALATADPAALCPLADAGAGLTDEPIWPVAQAICAGLSGDSAAAGVMLDQARSRRLGDTIDLQLAEKVLGTGVGGRRVVTLDWSDVDHLTAYRFGLAGALAAPIPDELWSTVGLQVQAWRARTPTVMPADRIAAARIAASLGVLSSAALVDLYSAVAETTDSQALEASPAGQLGEAYAGDDRSARMTALRQLWTASSDPRDTYAGDILTARAAARIDPDDALESDAAKLIAAMLSAGLDRQAARWGGVVEAMSGSDADPAWALLAVGAPRPVVDTSEGRVASYVKRAGDSGVTRARMLVAALAGLGRLSDSDAAALASETGFAFDDNRWSRAIALAASSQQPGTVALLAAVGMQTQDWRAVPPAFLFHIIRALRAVGREPEARMIAAEALTRT